MNVLLIAPEYPPHVVGGGGAVYKAIAEYLALQGHDVTVMFGDFRAKASGRKERLGGVELVGLPTFPPLFGIPWLLTAMPPKPQAWGRFLKILLGRSWDVAHLHGVGFPLIDAAAWLLRRRNIPYVFTCHSFPEAPLKSSKISAYVTKAYLQLVTRRTVVGAASVTAVSAATARNNEFITLPSCTRVIYNGIADDAFESDAIIAQKSPLMKVLSAGRLTYAKGFDIAIVAIALLRSRYGVTVQYDIWGADGGAQLRFQEIATRQGVADIVTFRGAFEPNDRLRIFREYDALLVPSRAEPFGLIALEGMASGLPVIAADRDGLRELVDDPQSLVPAEDAEALASALNRLYVDPDALVCAADSGSRRSKMFRWTAILPTYERCLAEATAAGK